MQLLWDIQVYYWLSYDWASLILAEAISEYYEQLHAKMLDNLEEMDKFLETYSPPKLSQEEIDNLIMLSNR